MPVPKRKTSKRRRDQRQSTKFIRPQIVAACKQCSEPNLPHQMCESCGFYKGRKIAVTKNERSVQRTQVREAAAKEAAARQGHEGHGHDDGHDHADHA